MKCSLCKTAEHGRNSRLRGGAMQSNSPLRSTTSVVSHLLTYLHNGRSQLCWPIFANYRPPTYPLLTFVGEFLYCHSPCWKHLHIVDTSSNTYLPGLVNVVCERPLICNYNWLSALRPLQIQKHPLWSESCSSIKYKKKSQGPWKIRSICYVLGICWALSSQTSAVIWPLQSHSLNNSDFW